MIEAAKRGVLHAAGYQGAGSILSASLQRFTELCRPSFDDAVCEADVTTSGESAKSLFASIDSGERQVAYMASGYLSAQVPELAVLDLPFSVGDRAAALAALDGEAGALLRQAVSQKTGMRVLGFWDNGFRHVTNRLRPIRTPADCAGLVIRTLDSALYRHSLSALGFKSVTTDVKELQRVVAAHEVDAQENPLTNFVNFGLWRHHPFVSLTGHFFGVLLLVCHAKWFDGLPAAKQQAVRHAAREATSSQRLLAAAEDEKAVAYLASQGVQITAAPDIALAEMRQCCAEVIARASMGLPGRLVASYLEA